MDLIDALKHVGLSEKEAQVYLALLSLDNASVYAIAKRSGLKRPTAYVIIDELEKKGLVFRVPRTRKQLYQAKSPDELIAETEARFAMVKQKLPELKALTKGRENKPRVYYYKGLEGMKQALHYGLKKMAGKEMVAFWATASAETLEKFDGTLLEVWTKIRELGIRSRGIQSEDPILDRFRVENDKYNRQAKTFSVDKYSPTVSITIADDLIKIEDYENVQALVIENPAAAKLLKQVFELVWEKK